MKKDSVRTSVVRQRAGSGTRRPARLAVWTALAAAALLSACGSPPHRLAGSLGLEQLTLLAQDANGNGVLDQLERPQSTKTCTQEPCELVVSVGGGVNRGRAGGIDCAVGVAPDVLMFGSRVGRLQWTLQAPADSRTEFRFRPQAAGGGVVVYANTQGRYFSVAQATPDRVVLARGQRVQEAYAYGIYLEWKPKDHPKDEWQACTPLDPIIIEHN